VKVLRVENYEQVSNQAAEIVLTQLRNNPRLVLGLATGSTPVGFYRRIVERYRQEVLDFSAVTTFNLDEYYPIKRSHPQSFASYMNEHFFRHVNIPAEHIHILDGETADVEEECRRFERAIEEAGGIDIQILGIGRNGHIGFNEPGTSFQSRTHLVALTESTIQANSRFFADAVEMPRHALTMGIATIMQSKRILLLAAGAEKAEAIRLALQGPVTEALPASVLQLHPDVTVIVDAEAASLLEGEDRYVATRGAR
jgi:glucosamine-6-phosphate deaminase